MARTITVEGLPELKAKMKELLDRADFQKAGQTGANIHNVVAEATDIAAREVEVRAKSSHVPGDAQQDIFAYHNLKAGAKDVGTMLAGVRRKGKRTGGAIQTSKAAKEGRYSFAGHGYREWRATSGKSWAAIPGGYLKRGGKRALKRGLKAGKIIGESLATMWEKGTSKMRARPFFRPAITSVRSRVVQHISNGFKRILETL